MLFVQGKSADAVPKLNRAVKSDPNSAEAHASLSRAYEALGQKRNAARESRQGAATCVFTFAVEPSYLCAPLLRSFFASSIRPRCS